MAGERHSKATTALIAGLAALASSLGTYFSQRAIAPAVASEPQRAPWATASQVELVAKDMAELKSDVRAYLVRVNVLEQWKAQQEGAEKQRTQDALLRERRRGQ